jgi:hypothetical protein
MGKTACRKNNPKDIENPKYRCKKCGSLTKKEEKVCKPVKLK